jgi:hypothetical protein
MRPRAQEKLAANKSERTTAWPTTGYGLGRGQAMLRNVNRTPRRWMDTSGRVHVIEGWHPSSPNRIGYNLMLDGDWVATLERLDDAAAAAAELLDVKDAEVLLRPYPDPRATGGTAKGAGLHLVRPAPDQD